jgi:hypothetical protein
VPLHVDYHYTHVWCIFKDVRPLLPHADSSIASSTIEVAEDSACMKHLGTYDKRAKSTFSFDNHHHQQDFKQF